MKIYTDKKNIKFICNYLYTFVSLCFGDKSVFLDLIIVSRFLISRFVYLHTVTLSVGININSLSFI